MVATAPTRETIVMTRMNSASSAKILTMSFLIAANSTWYSGLPGSTLCSWMVLVATSRTSDLRTELAAKKSMVEGMMRKRRMTTVALTLRVGSRKDCCRIWKMVGGDKGVVLISSLVVKEAMAMV